MQIAHIAGITGLGDPAMAKTKLGCVPEVTAREAGA